MILYRKCRFYMPDDLEFCLNYAILIAYSGKEDFGTQNTEHQKFSNQTIHCDFIHFRALINSSKTTLSNGYETIRKQGQDSFGAGKLILPNSIMIFNVGLYLTNK